MSDIVQDLKDSISVPAGADVNYSVPRWKIENAIKEIERLRSLVGAVTPGHSLADTKASLKVGSRESDAA
jgi:hypothetical protein